jgi:diguanylate cyclase (GGDEF)-like protein
VGATRAAADEHGLVDARRIAVLQELDLASALRRTLPLGVIACSAAAVLGFAVGELWLVAVCAPGAALFAVAWYLAHRGLARPATWLAVMTATALVTVSAVIGEGLNDSAVLAYPVILMFAAMTMDSGGLRTTIGVMVAGMIVLAGDQLFGWVPYSTPNNPVWADAIIVAVIMAATIAAVAQLAASARRALAAAQIEIELRRRAEDELRVLSTHDYLTSVFNRRFFDAEASRLAATRTDTVSVVAADIDDLKVTNDLFGHGAGDQLLVTTARLLESAVRAGDVVARVGGDEFAILLPGADAATAAAVVGRIDSAVAEHNRSAGSPFVHLSIGTATAAPANLSETIVQADARMYEKKSLRKGAPA